jgi:predicted chitinase
MWFWNENKLNSLADKDDNKAITLKINAKSLGEKKREEYKDKLLNKNK